MSEDKEKKNKKNKCKHLEGIIPNSEESDMKSNSISLIGLKTKRTFETEISEKEKEITSPHIGKPNHKDNIVGENSMISPKTEATTPPKIQSSRQKIEEIISNESGNEETSQNEDDLTNINLHPSDIFLIQLDKKYRQEREILSFDYRSNIPNLTQTKRETLFKWIMNMSTRLEMSRATFFRAVTLFDVYASLDSSHTLFEYQIIATCCLILANKFEDTNSSSSLFFDERFEFIIDPQHLKSWELSTLKVINYKLDYTTIFNFAEIVILKWECFRKKTDSILSLENGEIDKLRLYFYFILNFIIMDYNYRLGNMKSICVCILYSIVNYKINYLDKNQGNSPIETEFPNVNKNEIEGNKYFDNYFAQFLNKNKRLNEEDYHDYLLYVKQFTKKQVMDYISEKINQIPPEMINRRIFLSTYDEESFKIMKDVYK